MSTKREIGPGPCKHPKGLDSALTPFSENPSNTGNHFKARKPPTGSVIAVRARANYRRVHYLYAPCYLLPAH
ncbi:hypothetical protein EVAR_68675_1 [Eumeta japonica]|uniref:Uncharacterized protein n=1 Tax=Eumeta variegata TaxID=151549 RepID=A0A4C2AE31_EUMVA|nr:hypothetical protein EVAR_68675_1 [Eumeta japonica]